jgi:hypothetical protein
MAECPHCEYNKKRAQNWREEAYRLAGHPLPTEENQMTRPIGISVPHRRVDDDDDIQDYKKPWVGLTEDEVFAISNTMPYGDRFEFAKAIEQALKERNS